MVVAGQFEAAGEEVILPLLAGLGGRLAPEVLHVLGFGGDRTVGAAQVVLLDQGGAGVVEALLDVVVLLEGVVPETLCDPPAEDIVVVLRELLAALPDLDELVLVIVAPSLDPARPGRAAAGRIVVVGLLRACPPDVGVGVGVVGGVGVGRRRSGLRLVLDADAVAGGVEGIGGTDTVVRRREGADVGRRDRAVDARQAAGLVVLEVESLVLQNRCTVVLVVDDLLGRHPAGVVVVVGELDDSLGLIGGLAMDERRDLAPSVEGRDAVRAVAVRLLADPTRSRELPVDEILLGRRAGLSANPRQAVRVVVAVVELATRRRRARVADRRRPTLIVVVPLDLPAGAGGLVDRAVVHLLGLDQTKGVVLVEDPAVGVLRLREAIQRVVPEVLLRRLTLDVGGSDLELLLREEVQRVVGVGDRGGVLVDALDDVRVQVVRPGDGTAVRVARRDLSIQRVVGERCRLTLPVVDLREAVVIVELPAGRQRVRPRILDQQLRLPIQLVVLAEDHVPVRILDLRDITPRVVGEGRFLRQRVDRLRQAIESVVLEGRSVGRVGRPAVAGLLLRQGEQVPVRGEGVGNAVGDRILDAGQAVQVVVGVERRVVVLVEALRDPAGRVVLDLRRHPAVTDAGTGIVLRHRLGLRDAVGGIVVGLHLGQERVVGLVARDGVHEMVGAEGRQDVVSGGVLRLGQAVVVVVEVLGLPVRPERLLGLGQAEVRIVVVLRRRRAAGPVPNRDPGVQVVDVVLVVDLVPFGRFDPRELVFDVVEVLRRPAGRACDIFDDLRHVVEDVVVGVDDESGSPLAAGVLDADLGEVVTRIVVVLGLVAERRWRRHLRDLIQPVHRHRGRAAQRILDRRHVAELVIGVLDGRDGHSSGVCVFRHLPEVVVGGVLVRRFDPARVLRPVHETCRSVVEFAREVLVAGPGPLIDDRLRQVPGRVVFEGRNEIRRIDGSRHLVVG